MGWRSVLVYLGGSVQLILGLAHLFISDRPALKHVASLGANEYWQHRLQATLFAGSLTRAVIGAVILIAGYLFFQRQVFGARTVVLVSLLAPAVSALGIAVLTPSDIPKAIAHAVIVVVTALGVLA
jgi:hypothetical protein